MEPQPGMGTDQKKRLEEINENDHIDIDDDTVPYVTDLQPTYEFNWLEHSSY